jgi:hypothetical protein
MLPGIYLPSSINVDHIDIKTIYHPLKKQLNIDSSALHDYRSRTNTNIIGRRFSNKDQQTQEQVCKYRHNKKRRILPTDMHVTKYFFGGASS